MIGLEFACEVFNKDLKEIAGILNISAPNISSWLKGTREIPKKYLSELSRIFHGLPMEFFQKELTYIDELKIRIFYFESLDDEERYGEIKVYNEDNGELIHDMLVDDYSQQLRYLYTELNKALKINSYQERISLMIEQLWSIDQTKRSDLFKDKNPEEFIISKLNNYLDYTSQFNVTGIIAIDSIVNYFNVYHGLERSRWEGQELFPNEKLLSFYKDLEDVLNKHKVI